MVDFDRKWAEDGERSEQEDEDEEADGGEEAVEYVDEFGRTRKGTRWDIAREERRRRFAADDATNPVSANFDPSLRASNIIYGDTIQTHALTHTLKDAQQRMEEFVASGGRDRSLTPPAENHYDANWEVRNRGTGFFTFSKDEEERARQMDGLAREREETERVRMEKERKRKRNEAEGMAEAAGRERKKKDMEIDQFLSDLGREIDEKKR